LIIFLVCDSLDATGFNTALTCAKFFQRIWPPTTHTWKLVKPSNLPQQDDASSCGAFVLLYGYCIAKYGELFHVSIEKSDLRNFILKKLRGNCAICSEKQKVRCPVCKKITKNEILRSHVPPNVNPLTTRSMKNRQLPLNEAQQNRSSSTVKKKRASQNYVADCFTCAVCTRSWHRKCVNTEFAEDQIFICPKAGSNSK